VRKPISVLQRKKKLKGYRNLWKREIVILAKGRISLMNKRVLSLFLSLCMLITMWPVSAMAKEVHTTRTGGIIIEFAPLSPNRGD